MKKLLLSLFALMALSATAENEPFLTKVYDLMAAPGQFTNTMPKCSAGETKADVLKRAAEAICGRYEEDDWGDVEMIYKPGMISLGGYGGYVVVGFDHPVVNVKGDYDFQIFGNGFMATGSTSGGSSEPGIVMVSYDANGNGLPDDPWYELAGSEYASPKTQHNFTITYYKPATDKEDIRWTSNDANPDSISGYVYRNTFHQQNYWPLWAEGETLTFTGTKLANNAVDLSGTGSNWFQTCKAWGYVDNRSDYDPLSGWEYDEATMNRGFKIDWAVDADGTPVSLPMVHFIKVYNAMNQQCGWIGETSTEVAGGIDFHPQAAVPEPLKGDVNADGNVDVSDVTALINCILGQKSAGYNPVAIDVTADGNVDVSDVTALINLILQ
ncbi:MAG: dockerin type I repeat-containing protein [Bacteroidales bacterium]|nr:dockerin type I repeat-containing protein [Bacteroidales bacterium]